VARSSTSDRRLIVVPIGSVYLPMKPTVLIATTERWYPTVRLGMALAKAGCLVRAVCPSEHPFGKTKALAGTFVFDGLRPEASFAHAIATSKPDLIIPGDDLATRHLHQLHRSETQSGAARTEVSDLLERSLGDPKSFPVVYARSQLMDLADEVGVRVPKTEVVGSIDQLRTATARLGFPIVLKANGTSGGYGVRIVPTFGEAERAYRELQAPPRLARALKHAVIDRDTTLLLPSLLRRRPVVNAQTFIDGKEATSAVFCWNGAVLASVHFEVINKVHSTGHATVLKVVESREMLAAAEKIVSRLGLSGFHGFDFMIESRTGNAYLIEMNPRSTQVGHLNLGAGHDLPSAAYAVLSGQRMPPLRKITENDTIALFPQEWLRDPESPFLQSAYHDVPLDEPELVQDCMRKRRSQPSSVNRNWLPVASSMTVSAGKE
jgi:glutathione synthase/RimK-type ligase-like ATP-grasp enzyme